MKPTQPTFKELVMAAAKPHRGLWRDGKLNLGALARLYEQKGHPLSQASLSRILAGKQRVGPDAVEATFHVLGIPRNLLRGEPMSAEMERIFTKYRLETLLLAEKLEVLPPDEYYALVEQVERIIEREQRLKEAYRSSNVTPIERSKR
jgi:hypothetical protein